MEVVKEYKKIDDLDVGQLDDVNKAEFNKIVDLQGTTAAAICNTTLVCDMVAQFVEMESMASLVGGARLDVGRLMGEVAKIMPDMFMNMLWVEKYKCLDFMRRILYMIGPETRNVKKGRDNDKNWRIRMTSVITPEQRAEIIANDFHGIGDITTAVAKRQVDDKAISDGLVKYYDKIKTTDGCFQTVGMIIISTYKNGNAPTAQPKVGNGNVLLLTVKQATIVGLYILDKFTKLACAKGHDILTPLAGAIFSRDSMEKMMAEDAIKRVFVAKCDLINAINKSAQNGGQFLVGSRADIAAVCVVVGTSAIKKPDERKSICQRTVKQFLSHQREAEKDVFQAVCKYATGGVPEEWSYDTITSEYNGIRLNALAIRRALNQAQVNLN